MDLICRLSMREHILGSRESSRCVVPNLVQAADVTLAISNLKNTKSTAHDRINLQHIIESQMVTII